MGKGWECFRRILAFSPSFLSVCFAGESKLFGVWVWVFIGFFFFLICSLQNEGDKEKPTGTALVT